MCIYDKQLTKQRDILSLLERGDAIMADWGFDIQDDFIPFGVKLNMPPYLKGKSQLSSNIDIIYYVSGIGNGRIFEH